MNSELFLNVVTESVIDRFDVNSVLELVNMDCPLFLHWGEINNDACRTRLPLLENMALSGIASCQAQVN